MVTSPNTPTDTAPVQSTTPDCRLRRHQRIADSKIFRESFDQQKYYVGRYMVMYLRSGDGANMRLGVIASKKVGGAVARFKGKRLLRESFRRLRYQFQGDYDVILIARRRILQAKWDEITGELMYLAKKLELI